MAHIHKVQDTDIHFKIDGTTRTVKNVPETKIMLVQRDHNSERFTFEIPRMVDSHDMSACNVVQIHYINIDSINKNNQSLGVYEVDDLDVSPDNEDVVTCSWLISENATRYVGKLSFAIRFVCSTDGTVDYAWNTATYSGVNVTSGIYNGEEIAAEYADILEQWRHELVDSGGVTDERIERAVEGYMAEHPIEVPEASGGLNATASALLISILRNGVFTADQSANITALESALASSGESGGETPDDTEKTLTSISATYSGGDVPVGTSVYALTGIVVTAHYSDGSTATVTGYTLSGTIADGSNTVTVSYGGKTTTFTVTGVAESGGEDTALYGLHHDAGYAGKLVTGLKTTTIKKWNVDKIVLDIDYGTTTLPANNYYDLIMYPYAAKLAVHSSGEWHFNRSADNVTADKTPAEIMGKGRTVITFNIVFTSETNSLAWSILCGSSAPEVTWYGVKFYSGGTLLSDLKPTANLGDMYDSVSGETYTFSVTDGLTLVEV